MEVGTAVGNDGVGDNDNDGDGNADDRILVTAACPPPAGDDAQPALAVGDGDRDDRLSESFDSTSKPSNSSCLST